MTLESLLARFERPLRAGGGWKVICPSHADVNPSLSIAEKDGRLLIHCHAGCALDAVLAALKIDARELFVNGSEHASSRSKFGEPIATYDYSNEVGQLLFQVQRDAAKHFRQRRPGGKGDWIYNLEGVRRVLYRLPEVLVAEEIWVVEGEKDAETARKLGIVATTNPMGAGKWRDEHSETLRGKRVVIIPDGDEPGRKHAEAVARALHGKAASVKVVNLPAVAKDLSEWPFSREALLELRDQAPEWSLANLRPWREVFHTVEELASGEPVVLVENFLVEDVITAIGALSGVAKTWMGMSLAAALVTDGRKFLENHQVSERVNVLYLCPEMSERTVRRRAERFGLDKQPRFRCQTMKDGAISLDDPTLQAAIMELKPVIFLDTLTRFSTADDENAAAHNRKVANSLAQLLRWGARAVVILHHSPKGSAGAEEMTLENILRGTGDLGAMCAVVWGLRHARLKNDKNGAFCKESRSLGRFEVRCVKAQDLDKPVDPFVAQLRPHIDQRGEIGVLADFDLEEANATDVKERVEDGLRKFFKKHPDATQAEAADALGISQSTVSKWRRETGRKT